MPRPVLNEAQFVEKMNEKISADPRCKGGRVVLTPPGATSPNATGYDWEGPPGCEDLMARANAAIRSEYDLIAT